MKSSFFDVLKSKRASLAGTMNTKMSKDATTLSPVRRRAEQILEDGQERYGRSKQVSTL
jgi:dsDNA-specific endonuclease/ATPase MutS2